MRNRFTLVLTILILLLSSSYVKGQTPEGINYQAAIRDSIGSPINNQSVFVKFSVRQNSALGSIIFTETHSTITNEFGLINLVIGEIDPSGLATINWGIGTYFLQVEIDDGSGFEDLGASQLMSVPYALYAKNSGNSTPGPSGVDGFNTLIDTSLANTASCVNGGYQIFIGLDINSNSELDPLEITSSFILCNGEAGTNGSAGVDGISINWLGVFSSIPTSPNPNDAYYHSLDNISYIFNTFGAWDTLVVGGIDSDWEVVGNDLYSLPIGNVGIGTVTPSEKLTLISNDSIVSSFTGTNANLTAIKVVSNNATATTGVLFVSGTDSGTIALNPVNNRMGISNTFNNGNLILNTDSVIGFAADYARFNINDRINYITDTITSSSPSSNVIHRNFGTFLTDSLYLLGNGMNNLNYVLANDGFGQAKWTDASTLSFQAGLWQSNVSNIFFNTGNVGIGTSSPSAPMQIQINSNSSSAMLNGLTITHNITSGFGSNGIGTQLIFQAENNVGTIQNTSLFGSQLIDATSGNENSTLFFQTLTNGSLTEKIRINENGNVGIGTSAPNAKLDVVGTFRLSDGTQSEGNILTSDANGNATWKQNRIAFEAQPSNINQDFDANIPEVLILDSELLDQGNGYNPSTNIFTAPVAGVYAFQIQLTVTETSIGTPSNLILELLRNGSVIRESVGILDNDNSTSVTMSVTKSLSAGDQISSSVSLISSNSTLNITVSSITGTWFSGHLVYEN